MAIDLNADLGEGFGVWSMGDDEALLSVVTSANIACGFHAGDPSTMARTCARAADQGVAIGAHVGYRDLIGFGRRQLDVAPAELRNDVLAQIGALDAFARRARSRVRYVKPHGALYHRACQDPHVAHAVVKAVADFDPELEILALPGSELLTAAASVGVTGRAEGYLDRGYRPDGTLVSRDAPGGIVAERAAVVERAVRLACSQKLEACDGTDIHLDVVSLCTHGDTPGAVELARAVRNALVGAGIELAAFASAPSPASVELRAGPPPSYR